MSEARVHTNVAKRSPTLTTINNDVLLSILQNIPLTYMRGLESTCRHLHAYIHDPKIVIPLFSSAPQHPMVSLSQYPYWALAEKGMILDYVLAGPKPPLFYVEEFLARARYRPSFADATIKLTRKFGQWYPSLPETLTLFGDPSAPMCFDLMTTSRFRRIFESAHLYPEWLFQELLQRMRQEELLPFFECFNRLRSDYVMDDEIEFLNRPEVLPYLPLRDLLPRLRYYLPELPDYPELFHLVQSLVDTAAPAEVLVLEKHILQLCEDGYIDRPQFEGILAIYPSILTKRAAHQKIKNLYLKYILHHSTLLWQIDSLVAGGAWCDMANPTLAQNIMREKKNLEGWSGALDALQRHQPIGEGETKWCVTQHDFDTMMCKVLELAESAVAGVPSHTGPWKKLR
ncbi:hypothetical protein HDV00_000491 [Rhizophlyctis rosea]|nr:hypothetical protein HDV00_000491 [Rhizophlyctis rosea]